MVGQRKQVRARLTPAALKAWERVLADNGLTWTSMFEALGQDIAAGQWEPSAAQIEEARRIDWERKSRR